MTLEAAGAQPDSPPRVILVSRYFHPFVGGLEKRVGFLARELAARGIHVEIVTSGLYPKFPQQQTQDGVIIHRLPTPRIKVFGACIFIARLVRFLYQRRSRYQFLHAFLVGHSSGAAVLTGRLLGKRVFFHLSGSGSGGDVGRHIKTPWGWVFLALCRLASGMIVLNKQMQRELRILAYPSSRTVCIPNGVDTRFYQPHEDRAGLRQSLGMRRRPIILYTGRLSAEKGVEILVRAHALLQSPSAPALYIVGSGPGQQRLEHLIRKLHIENRTTIVPACSDIRSYYQCADIFVMPSFHEGISNSILEAMACALPVVATAVSGNTDLVRHRHNGLLVPPKNPATLAAAIDELLNAPDTARTMGVSGRHIAETHYCADEMINRCVALYARQHW